MNASISACHVSKTLWLTLNGLDTCGNHFCKDLPNLTGCPMLARVAEVEGIGHKVCFSDENTYHH
jgi:hypothetical protein